MSETPLAAAAAALGMPEDLTLRSAEARAAETGSSVDEILNAWAGGEAMAATPSAAPAEPPSVEESTEPPDQQPDPVPEVVIETSPSEVAPLAAAPVGDYRPPVLVGPPDKPGTIIVGAIGMFLVVLMLGLIGPSVAVGAGCSNQRDPLLTGGGRWPTCLWLPRMCGLSHSDGATGRCRCWSWSRDLERHQPGGGRSTIRTGSRRRGDTNDVEPVGVDHHG